MGQTASALPDDDNQSLDNLNFYTGKISSKPDGGKIDLVLKNWFGDWDLLEAHHGYVQCSYAGFTVIFLLLLLCIFF